MRFNTYFVEQHFIGSLLLLALSHAHTGGHYVSQDSRAN